MPCTCARPVTPCPWFDPDQPGLYTLEFSGYELSLPRYICAMVESWTCRGWVALRTERIERRAWGMGSLPKRTALHAQSPRNLRGRLFSGSWRAGELASRLRG